MRAPPRYERIGWTGAEARTRAALLDAARELLAEGRTPNVGEAAEAAGVSRATAYRYFPYQRALGRSGAWSSRSDRPAASRRSSG